MNFPAYADRVSISTFDGHSVDVYLAKSADAGGVMVALVVPPDAAERLVIPGYELASALHCTLAYLGADVERGLLDRVHDALAAVAELQAPLRGTVGGYGRFSQEDGAEVAYAVLDCPGLEELQQVVVKALEALGAPVNREHGFTPHITLAYLEEGEALPDTMPERLEIDFRALTFKAGNVVSTMDFCGDPADAAVADAVVDAPAAPETPDRVEAVDTLPGAAAAQLAAAEASERASADLRAAAEALRAASERPMEVTVVSPPPIVNVAAPQVTVMALRKRKTRKTVERDAQGRISAVVETEED